MICPPPPQCLALYFAFLGGVYCWLGITNLLITAGLLFTAVLLVGSAPGALICSYIVLLFESKLNTSRSLELLPARLLVGWLTRVLAGWLAGLLALLAVISSPCVLLCFLLVFYHWLIIISLLFTAGLLITVVKFSRVNDFTIRLRFI